VLLTISWALLHAGFWGRDQIVDTPVYERYGEAVLDGQVPYRDFDLEYPPAALPMFVLPAVAREDDYSGAFELLMWACAVAAIVALGLALTAVDASAARLFAAIGFVALAPLALGSVILSRYDLWPAALTIAALAALLGRRERLGFGILGLAVAAKIYPLVLLPLALVWVARRRGTREVWIGLGCCAAVVAACFLPFLILSPGGVAHSIGQQLGRPLQIESLGASILLAADRLGLYDATVAGGGGGAPPRRTPRSRARTAPRTSPARSLTTSRRSRRPSSSSPSSSCGPSSRGEASAVRACSPPLRLR